MKTYSLFLSSVLLFLMVCLCCATTTITSGAPLIAIPIQDKLWNNTNQHLIPIPKQYWIARDACSCESSWRLFPNFLYRDCEQWLQTASDFILIPDHLCHSCGLYSSLRPELYCDTNSCRVILSSWISTALFVTLITWTNVIAFTTLMCFLLSRVDARHHRPAVWGTAPVVLSTYHLESNRIYMLDPFQCLLFDGHEKHRV